MNKKKRKPLLITSTVSYVLYPNDALGPAALLRHPDPPYLMVKKR